MAEKYETLYRLPDNLYATGSPVIIVAGALLKENPNGNVIAQLKFTSLSRKEIVGLKVKIEAFDISGVMLYGDKEVQYLDLKIGRNQSFGSNQAIQLPNPVTRKINVSCSSVAFSDGSSWVCPIESTWESLPEQDSVQKALGNADLCEQYRIENGNRCKFIPVREKDLWSCGCGTWNREAEMMCYSCGREYFNLDLSKLKENCQARLELEEEERKAAEEAARVKAELRAKKFKKLCAILIPVLIVVFIGIQIGSYIFAGRKADAGDFSGAADTIFIQQITDIYDSNFAIYLSAGESLEDGDYESAKENFESLGDYREAPAYLTETIYREAIANLEDEEYDLAAEAFNSLGDYKDSEAYVTETKYQEAITNLENKKLELAEDAFKELDDYKKSSDYLTETKYQEAIENLKDKEYVLAAEAFNALGDYKESKEKIKEISEIEEENVNSSLSKGKYEEAKKLFDSYGMTDFQTFANDYASALESDHEYKKAFAIYEYLGETDMMSNCNASMVEYIKKSVVNAELAYTDDLNDRDCSTDTKASDVVTIRSLKYSYADGYVSVTVSLYSKKNCGCSFFNPPNGTKFMQCKTVSKGNNTLTFTLPLSSLLGTDAITCKIYSNNISGYFFLDMGSFSALRSKDCYGNTIFA